jgi:hypothetical protein
MGMQSIERKLGSYIEILKQDTIDPAENTKLGLDQLRQTMAEISEFVSRAEELSSAPDPAINLVLEAMERGGGGPSGRLESLGGDLQRVTGERDYAKKRLEEVDYVVSSLRSEKASLEREAQIDQKRKHAAADLIVRCGIYSRITIAHGPDVAAESFDDARGILIAIFNRPDLALRTIGADVVHHALCRNDP